MMNNFVDTIVSLMQKQNISQTELSRVSGITQSSISDWICGKYLPKKDKIEILAKVFKVSPSYLIGWQDDRVSDLSVTKNINIREHNIKIGQRIKHMREQLGLSQEELAKRIGSSNRSTVSNYEQGNRTFKQSQIALFSKALDTTPAYLMGWEEDTKCENVLDDDTTKLLDLYNKLNDLGKEKAIDTLSDLTCITKYTEKRKNQELLNA